MTHSDISRVRSYPQPCPECGKIEIRPAVIAYDGEIKHNGRLHAIRVPELHINRCGACGEVYFDNATDDQISRALRTHLGLLSPQEIRQRLGVLGLTQKEFGEEIAVAPETISRWLSGAYIQSPRWIN